MIEKWISIPGDYTGYMASNLGNIKSIDRTINFIRLGRPASRRINGTILAPCLNRYGYEMVVLTRPGHRKLCSVHRLVMLAFIGKSELTVNHMNGLKSENRLTNLEYATHSENLLHAHRTGLKKATRTYKHSDEFVLKIKETMIKNNYSWKVSGEILNVKAKNIQSIICCRDKEFYVEVLQRKKKL